MKNLKDYFEDVTKARTLMVRVLEDDKRLCGMLGILGLDPKYVSNLDNSQWRDLAEVLHVWAGMIAPDGDTGWMPTDGLDESIAHYEKVKLTLFELLDKNREALSCLCKGWMPSEDE